MFLNVQDRKEQHRDFAQIMQEKKIDRRDDKRAVQPIYYLKS